MRRDGKTETCDGHVRWALQMRARREAAVALEGEMKRTREKGWQDGKQAGRKAGAQGAGGTCGAFDEP